MNPDKRNNIENSTYRGLIVVTITLMSIFIFKTLLFSYDIHSYDDSDNKFESNVLFEDSTSENNEIMVEDKSKIDSLSKQNIKQKNIIKDLTVKQKIVNINRSLKDELIKLPGIGPKTADKIIEYRKANGDFMSIDELKKVKGIGPAKLKKIENLIKLK